MEDKYQSLERQISKILELLQQSHKIPTSKPETEPIMDSNRMVPQASYQETDSDLPCSTRLQNFCNTLLDSPIEPQLRAAVRNKVIQSYEYLSRDEIFAKWDQGLCEWCEEARSPLHICDKTGPNCMYVIEGEYMFLLMGDCGLECQGKQQRSLQDEDVCQVFDELPQSQCLIQMSDNLEDIPPLHKQMQMSDNQKTFLNRIHKVLGELPRPQEVSHGCPKKDLFSCFSKLEGFKLKSSNPKVLNEKVCWSSLLMSACREVKKYVLCDDATGGFPYNPGGLQVHVTDLSWGNNLLVTLGHGELCLGLAFHFTVYDPGGSHSSLSREVKYLGSLIYSNECKGMKLIKQLTPLGIVDRGMVIVNNKAADYPMGWPQP